MKDFLSIGEISSLFGLSVQTLHYYDRIHLFEPAVRDLQNNYRRYRFDQVYQLASIRYLRKMGCSVQDIKQFLNSRNPDRSISFLRNRSVTLRREWAELMRIDEAIFRKINFIERKLANLDTESIEIRWYPERYYFPIGSEEQLYMDDSFYFYPTMAFYEDDLKLFGAYVEDAASGLPEGGAVPPPTAAIPAGYYLTGCHCGSYDKVTARIREIRNAYSHLELGSLTTTFNIIDQFVERNSENYITEIQIYIQNYQSSADDGER